MKKRILALLSILALTLALFAGCGSAPETPVAEAPAAEAPAAEAPAEEAPAEEAPAEKPADDGETYNLIVSLTKGQNNTTALQDYLADIEAASNGRITFEIYYSGQLLAVPEIPQGLDSGIADISEFILSEFPSMFPLSSTIPGLPFLGLSNDTIKTFQRLYDDCPEIQQEFANANMVMLSYLCTQPYNIHLTSDKPVVMPEDLSGLKLITTRVDISNFLGQFGASAVASAPPDFYTNLSNGVVDGTVLHFPMMFNNGLIPTTKQHLLVEEGGGIYADTSVYVMSQTAWDRLPADLQALFTDEARLEKFFTDNQASLETDSEKGLQECEDEGDVIHYMTEEELAAWKDAFAPINEQTLADLDAQGLPATDIYNHALEIIAELKG